MPLSRWIQDLQKFKMMLQLPTYNSVNKPIRWGQDLTLCTLHQRRNLVPWSWSPDPLIFWQWGSKCARTPHFLLPCCYTWPVIHISSADSGWTLHARWYLYGTLNINVDFIRLFDCINCIKMFGSGWAGSAQTPWRVHEREGKKGGLKEGQRWPGPPSFMTDRRHWTSHTGCGFKKSPNSNSWTFLRQILYTCLARSYPSMCWFSLKLLYIYLIGIMPNF